MPSLSKLMLTQQPYSHLKKTKGSPASNNISQVFSIFSVRLL
ncbi:MAG: hypothetical protein P8O09_06465 [Flavobacteriaceae bacterium]|nr:hypothetical protein [Flavobacteriaceae bacterium]